MGRRWAAVVTFATAMAWVESACVYYLRILVNRVEPYQPNPLPLQGALGQVELVREAATLVMLLMVGIVAGRTWRRRFAYAAIGFGVWDIAYYVFLRMMGPWPHSLLDWDILFLIPLPWWGPIIAPMAIACLMIAWGTLTTQMKDGDRPSRNEVSIWSAAGVGTILALGVFMADAPRAMPGGESAVRSVLPASFNWPLFVLAFVLMSVPVAQLLLVLLRAVRERHQHLSSGNLRTEERHLVGAVSQRQRDLTALGD
jgi:hypothetical protein